jgi:hypothetical protein
MLAARVHLIERSKPCKFERHMTSPHYISEDKSDMRGIKSGWYAMDDDGNLSSGPFSSLKECIKRITQPTNGTNDGI